MLLFVFLIVAGCAVKCDETRNYYVIEVPDDEVTLKSTKKPFDVYWNVPTMQCTSKGILFENLFEKYGINQNKDDSFRGEKIAILYDPGLFPALLKSESGDLKYRNGGVPQEGSLEKHLSQFKNDLDASIPDSDFNGIGIIDFESWRPVFRQNFGVLTPYQDVSMEIERQKHWWWKKDWIRSEAKSRFEEAARLFMQGTISLAKKLRPNAKWGYYGFPYCFNVANNNMEESCAKGVPKENDQIYWLWQESSALYPSVYSSTSLSTQELSALIRGRVAEASRVGGRLILPYYWYRYRDGGFFTQEDLNVALKTFYQSKASGFIIWGSSNDVNTVEKCNKLLDYLNQTLGPSIAKYTKQKQVNDETSNDIYIYNDTTINNNTILTTDINSLLEIVKNGTENITTFNIAHLISTQSSFEVKNNPNYSILVDMILSMSNNTKENDKKDEIIKDEDENFMAPEEAALYNYAFDDTTTSVEPKSNTTEDLNFNKNILETSTNNIQNLTFNTENSFNTATTYSIKKEATKTSTDNSKTTLYDKGLTEATDYPYFNKDSLLEFKELIAEVSTTVGDKDFTSTPSYEYSYDLYTDYYAYENVEFITSDDVFVNETDSIAYNEIEPTNIKKYIELTPEFSTKIDSLELNTKGNDDKLFIDDEEIKSTSIMRSRNEVTGSAAKLNLGRKYFICIFFYLYSVSKCLCDVYGQCS